MITIIDYGLGNLSSIKNMLVKIGVECQITSSPEEINTATKLILPGVGAFDDGMSNIEKMGLREVLDRKVLVDKTPVLGICLGMQLMTKGSEEGNKAGLGWVNGRAIRFISTPEKFIRIPHMGWNEIKMQKPSKLYTQANDEEVRFYFVHAYYIILEDQKDMLMETTYSHPFVSSFESNNIVGVQFHPEKSHRFGMQLLKNFSEKF